MRNQDERNRKAYTTESAQRWYRGSLDVFLGEGERAAYDLIAAEGVTGPILDLGVGGGRTVELGLSLSEDYTALDYLPEMVEICRSRYPDVNVVLGDARDLSAYSDGHFAMVMFSCNGLDSLDHSSRLQVLAEAFRVLRPGGIFWFSTLNRDGPLAHRRPWKPTDARSALMAVPDSYRFWRTRQGTELTDTYAIAPIHTFGYNLLVHFTRLRPAIAELTAAGFEDDVVVFRALDSRRVEDLARRDVASDYWQLVAHKPLADGRDGLSQPG